MENSADDNVHICVSAPFRKMDLAKGDNAKDRHDRHAVFKAHVLKKLFPSEGKQEEVAAQARSSSSNAPSEKHPEDIPPKLLKRPKQVYTVQLPPEGLEQVLAQTRKNESEERSTGDSSESDSSDETEDNVASHKRRRKRKYRRTSSKLKQSSGKAASCSFISDESCTLIQAETKQETHHHSPSAKSLLAVQLTKNQRKKLRKKRAKLSKLQDQPSKRVTEFVYDSGKQEPDVQAHDPSDV